MGSPITFSGFNSIDFSLILNAVMAQERQPLAALETRKATLESQNSAFATLAGKLSSLGTAADNLKDLHSLSVLTASSSDAGVGVSTTSGTLAGTYDIVVSELARAQVTASAAFAATSTVVGTGGSITLTPTTGAPVTIALTGSTTLAGLADLINAKTDSPVAASVVQSSPGSYQLVLTGKETGAANAFTITSALTGGAGVTFGANKQDAINSAFTVNGLAVTSASNTVTDVIPGVTLSLAKKDPATTVTVKVARDEDKAEALVKSFVDAYNNIVSFTKDQSTAAAAGRASIARDPLLRSFKDNIRAAMMDDYAGGSFTKLAGVGIGFDRDGKMTLDTDVFDKAMSSSLADVQRLFSGTDGTGGAFGKLSTLLDDYTQAGGFVASARQRIDAQVSGINTRLDSMEAALEIRRRALQQEYIAADLAMTRLKSQSASLGSVGSGISF